MPTTARKRHRIGTGGPWGSALLILGMALTVQGVGYATATPGRLPAALDALSQYVPPWAWGALWVAAGAWSVWQALTPPQSPRDVIPGVVVLSVWSAAYLVHWLVLGVSEGEWTRSWSSGVAWAMLAGVISSLGRCVNPPTVQSAR